MMEREDDRAHNHLTEDLERCDGIRAAHINCNDLKNKLDEVELLLKSADFGTLALTESHLTDEITDEELNISDYEIIQKDRDGKSPWGRCRNLL